MELSHTITIACYALINVVVVDVSIEHGLNTSFEAQLWVVDLASGLNKFSHSNAYSCQFWGEQKALERNTYLGRILAASVRPSLRL